MTSQTLPLGQPSNVPSTQSKSDKQFKRWSKKRTMQRPIDIPIIADSSLTSNENYNIHEALDLTIYISGGTVKGTGWAAIWLRRLKLRKKSRKSENSIPQNQTNRPRLITLAEQLQEAQPTPLSQPSSKVFIYLNPPIDV
jgi:hypothetical protein